MDKTNISDSLMVGYDQAGDDLPVLTIGRHITDGDKIEIVRVLGGESASDLYRIILDYGNKSGIINARMMNDHNNLTMLMPKGNGRSMVKRNIADMFDTNYLTKDPKQANWTDEEKELYSKSLEGKGGYYGTNR